MARKRITNNTEMSAKNVLFVAFRVIEEDSTDSQHVLFVGFHEHENASHKQSVLFYNP